MADCVQDRSAGLLPPRPAADPVGLALLLDFSLAHPASPALAASTAIAAMAATLICLIRALLTLTPKIKRIIIPNVWARAPPAPASAASPAAHPPAHPMEAVAHWLRSY